MPAEAIKADTAFIILHNLFWVNEEVPVQWRETVIKVPKKRRHQVLQQLPSHHAPVSAGLGSQQSNSGENEGGN
jgi:hypothetical protein